HADAHGADHQRVRARKVPLEQRRIEARHRGHECLDLCGQQSDRLRAVTALELEEDVLVLGQRAEPVDGVGREDHRAAGTQLGDGVVHLVPSTTRSIPVRSLVTRTSRQPAAPRISATSRAWPSPTSKTTKGAFAARASRSCSPRPTSATSGSRRSSGWSSSRLSTYGGLATTTSQPSAATPAPSPCRSSISS